MEVFVGFVGVGLVVGGDAAGLVLRGRGDGGHCCLLGCWESCCACGHDGYGGEEGGCEFHFCEELVVRFL